MDNPAFPSQEKAAVLKYIKIEKKKNSNAIIFHNIADFVKVNAPFVSRRDFFKKKYNLTDPTLIYRYKKHKNTYENTTREIRHL